MRKHVLRCHYLLKITWRVYGALSLWTLREIAAGHTSKAEFCDFVISGSNCQHKRLQTTTWIINFVIQLVRNNAALDCVDRTSVSLQGCTLFVIVV
jgi:hypothetical protein